MKTQQLKPACMYCALFILNKTSKSATAIKKSLSIFLQILKVWLLDTWLTQFWALIFIQRLFTLNVCYSRSKLTDWTLEGWIQGEVQWRHLVTSIKFQRVNAAYYICKTRVWKSESPKLPCCIYNISRVHTNCILMLVSLWCHFLLDPALSSFKVSNGGLLLVIVAL